MRKSYRIIDGVRRAKAAQLAGHLEIWAVIAGRDDEERKFAIEVLLSPKKRIELSSAHERKRWQVICEGMAEEPDLLPPIIVKPGTRGVPIADVAIIDEGVSDT